MAHPVTLSLAIVQAIEPPSKPLPFYETKRNNCHKRIYEGIIPQHYFHMEYQLMPGSANELYQTDVVTYGVVAKIYTKHDERVVTTWIENGLTYYGWKHSHKISLSLESLYELYDHTLTVQLWNRKEKISARAKYDRPKAFRLPVLYSSDDKINTPRRPLQLPGVYHFITQQSSRRNRRYSSEAIEYEESNESVISPQKSLDIPPLIDEQESSMNASELHEKVVSVKSVGVLDPPTTFFFSPNPGLKGIPKSKVQYLNKPYISDNSMVTLSIKLADLFGSCNVIKSSTKDVAELKYFEVSLQLESPLMTDGQRKLLSPMTITINDCCSMPTPSEEIERYAPVFVSYQFYDKPKIHTPSIPHSDYLHWNDSNVLLLGTIKPELLLEYLRGPPLIFEIHDRDREEKDKNVRENTVFGQLKTDSVLNNCNYGKYADFKNVPSLFSEAKLDLSCLLSGLQKMKFTLPVQDLIPVDADVSKKIPQTNNAAQKDYLFCGSQLSITIELSYPLTLPSPLSSVSEDILSQQRPLVGLHDCVTLILSKTPFGRLIYIISSEGRLLVQNVLTLLNDINSNGLNLTELPHNARNAALSTYKLTYEQICSPQCDVITGFHVEDTSKHIFVLEGLYWKGLRKVWEEVPHDISEDSNVMHCFYNSDYTFASRLYGTLDVDLVHITLTQPLETIVQDTMLYFSIPVQCCEMLLTLHELKIAQNFSSIVKNNMFPTVDMITSLSLCLANIHLSSGENGTVDMIHSEQLSNKISTRRKSRSWEPLNNINSKYEMLIKQRESTPPTNKIMENISRVHLMSQQVNRTKKQRARSASEGNKAICLYSSQTYNSSVVGKAALREILSSRDRFTYCQSYHSMTVEPVDTEKELKRYLFREDKAKWRTRKGFVFPGVKTTLESNMHPKKPDSSRIEELQTVFQDNVLHSNTLKPTLDRCVYGCTKRAFDFERYLSPPLYFGTEYPVTIHLAGDSQENEVNSRKYEEQKQWESKIIVKDKRFYTFRQGSRTEMCAKGPLAARQQDKLKGILKDEPAMLSLAPFEGVQVGSIPALSVIHNGNKDMDIASFIPRSGPESCNSLKRDCNIIPIPKTVPCGNIHQRDFCLY